MTTVDEIVTATRQLTFDERAELARRMGEWEDDEWDRQMATDLKAGKLDDLIGRARADIRAGRVGRPREIDDQR